MIRPSSPSPVFVKVIDDRRLFLRFDNSEEKVFDISPYLEDPYFEALRNRAVFSTARTPGLTVEWMGGIDICPDELYETSSPV